MPRAARLWLIAIGVVAALGVGAVALLGFARNDPPPPRQDLGLFTSLPILWGEADSVSAMLASPEAGLWSKQALEARYRINPLDVLTPPPGLRRLLIAQPRPLSPQENVALDNFVRGGGQVLLFADPMLTWESKFALGDKRRPQDVVLLSPILARWGLDLRFDEAQPAGEHDLAGLPVNLPGSLAIRPGGLESTCNIGGEGLIAECVIGKGRVLIVADAALLEPGADDDQREQAFEILLGRAFPH